MMELEEFEEIVEETVENLPLDFKSKLENLDIVVEIWPSEDDTLFGLYRGVPITKRGNNYSGVLPDKITIFAGPIIQFSKSIVDLKKQIRKTVLHEIGHHFGMSESSIRKAQKENN